MSALDERGEPWVSWEDKDEDDQKAERRGGQLGWRNPQSS